MQIEILQWGHMGCNPRINTMYSKTAEQITCLGPRENIQGKLVPNRFSHFWEMHMTWHIVDISVWMCLRNICEWVFIHIYPCLWFCVLYGCFRTSSLLCPFAWDKSVNMINQHENTNRKNNTNFFLIIHKHSTTQNMKRTVW